MRRIFSYVFPPFALAALLSCSGYDGKNPVGADLARKKELDRAPLPPLARTFTPGHGLDTAVSVLSGLPGNHGPARLGIFRGDTARTFVEFSFPRIPPDFFKLDDQGAPADTGDRLHGVDSARLYLRFSGNSPFGAGPRRSAQLLLSRAERPASLVIDTATPLLSVPLTFSAAGDSGVVDVAFDSSSHSLFDYLRESLHADSGDTPRVAFALRLDDTTLLSLDPDSAPRLTLYGKSAPVYCASIGDSVYCWNGDTLIPDSAVASLRRLYYYVTPESLLQHDQFYAATPVISTLFFQSGDTSGFFNARFRVNVDTLFQGLNLDSVDILGATAVFYDTAYNKPSQKTYGEAERFSLDLKASVVMFDAAQLQVRPASNLFSSAETLYVSGFTPGLTHSLTYPIHKYLAAFMDPQYRNVKTLEFRLSALPSFNTFNQIVFQKRVQITIEYIKRFSWNG